MITVGITGIDGLIGWHLRAFFHGCDGVLVKGANRQTFSSDDALEEFVSASDVIIHLAGMNRGDDSEIENTNVRLTEKLIDAVEKTKCRPHILFASSTHADRDTAYGRSKRKCSELLRTWADKREAVFSNLILPHVFGEGGKPYYNSVVSTFCHQLAQGEVSEVVQDNQLELLHTRKLARDVWHLIQERQGGECRLSGVTISVSELLSRLEGMAERYKCNLIPAVEDDLNLELFNTYRSYLFPNFYPVSLVKHDDERGELFEWVKSLNPGQSFVSTTRPGITRGNHYHQHKIERFLVIRGEAVIRIRKLFSDQVNEFKVSGSKPEYIDIPTFHAHNITNISESELITLFWAHEILDPDAPDTYGEMV